MDSKYTFSVIIPHKNTPKLLIRCVASIPERPDVQVIVVDDNSDVDMSETISLLQKRENLVFFRNSIGNGAGAARNIGLKLAKGEWLLFSDSDDYFSKGSFERFDKYVNSTFDIIYFGCTSVDTETLEPSNRNISNMKILGDFKQGNVSEDEVRIKIRTPWGKMIRSELVASTEASFDEVVCSNDVFFSVKVGLAAKSIEVDLFPAYCITFRRGSLVTIRTPERWECRFVVEANVNKYLLQKGKGDYQLCLLYYVILAYKYGGFSLFWRFVKILYSMKINPFYGFNNLVKNHINRKLQYD